MRYAKYLYIKYTKATAPSRDEMAPTIVDQENELFRSELKNIIKKKNESDRTEIDMFVEQY